MTKIPQTIIEHNTREENLRAAKQSAKEHEGSVIQHRIEYWKDVIDIVIGMDVIERHICYGRSIDTSIMKGSTNYLEDMALYR